MTSKTFVISYILLLCIFSSFDAFEISRVKSLEFFIILTNFLVSFVNPFSLGPEGGRPLRFNLDLFFISLDEEEERLSY